MRTRAPQSDPARLAEENAELRRRLAEAEEELTAVRREHRAFAERYVALEKSTSALSNLYVASARLHETSTRRELLQVVEEILNALVGSEEIAVFEREGDWLVLLAASGVDPERIARLSLGEGRIGDAVLRGETFVAGDETSEVRACVPLKVGDEAVGAIAIYGLLPQKAGFEPRDLELFDLLATQVARALVCTRVRKIHPASLPTDKVNR